MGMIRLVFACLKYVVTEFISHYKSFTKNISTYFCFSENEEKGKLSQSKSSWLTVSKILPTNVASSNLYKYSREPQFWQNVSIFYWK